MAIHEVSSSFQLMTSNNGVDALEKLSNEKIVPDVIFLDLNMPRLDGWECLQRLKAIDHLQTTPVVIYSTSEPSREVLTNKKFDLFLTKQPKISELVIKLKDVFSQLQAGNYVDASR